MSKVCSRPPYSNCKVYNKDGDLIFRCSAKKIHWYLKNDLAEFLTEESIKLKINTKGPGHLGDQFFLQDRHNVCAVCGTLDKLTRHHIMPECYRKHFPDDIKSHASYDVTILCICCHEGYEKLAWELKQAIAKEFDCPMEGRGDRYDKKFLLAKKSAGALKFHRIHMPPARVESLLKPVRDYLQREVRDEDIENIYNIPLTPNPNHISHGKYIVSQLSDLESFVRKWREHFISRMKPKHLPDGWEIDRSIFRE